MTIENTASFVESWRGKSPSQIREEMSSLSVESLGKHDNYFFWVKNGRLISPETGLPVSDSVAISSALYQREYQALLALEGWSASNNLGEAIWVSPPYGEVYPAAKITVSEIKDRGDLKTLENTAIILDISPSECIEIANKLMIYSRDPLKEYSDPEVLRADVILISPLSKRVAGNWVDILESAVGERAIFDQIREDIRGAKNIALEKASKYQQMIEKGLPAEYIVAVMRKDNFLGDGPLSCPPSVSDVMLRHSRLYGEKKFVRNCGKCGKTINAFISPGYQCSCGGVYEGC